MSLPTSAERPAALVPAAGSTSDVRRLLLVASLVLLTRLPFLGPGYGADPDAWRVAWAARVLATTGQYEASRFPGYPLQEFVASWMRPGGPWALNFVAALLCALGAGFFALTLRRLGSRDGVLAALALASAPAIFLASVTAMDYAWALGFALAALDFALRGRALTAGVLLGLAIGCRIPSAGFLPPLAMVLAGAQPRGTRLRHVARFCAVALAVGAIAFAPVFLTYGAGFLRFYEFGYPRALFVLKNASVDLWGVPGAVGVALACLALLLQRGRPAADSSIPPRHALAWACACGIAVFALAYLRLPIKAFYLIPVVPFALLLLGRLLPRRAFLALCVALMASPWVLEVWQPGKPDSPAPVAGTMALRLGGQNLAVDLFRGPVLADHERRARGMRYVEASLERARRLPGESVVAAYDWLPHIRVLLGGKRDGRVEFVYLLTRAEIAGLARRGVSLYDMAGAEPQNEKVNGVSLRASGSRPLE